MQNNINTIIDELNGHLSKLNKKVKMSTPFLHDTITEYRCRKQERYLIGGIFSVMACTPQTY